MAPVHQRAKGSDTSPGQKRRLWGDLPMYAVGQTWIPLTLYIYVMIRL